MRLALGWAYILLHQALYTLLVPDEYFYSQAFQVGAAAADQTTGRGGQGLEGLELEETRGETGSGGVRGCELHEPWLVQDGTEREQ